MNEGALPASAGAQAVELFQRHLQGRFRTVAELSRALRSRVDSFQSVRPPRPEDVEASAESSAERALFYEWVTFRFRRWEEVLRSQYEALRKGADVQTMFETTYIKRWFIEQMKELVELEEEILKHKGGGVPDDLLIRAKKDGFADRYLSQLLGLTETAIRERRRKLGVVEGWYPVPVSGVENVAYYYSTYNAPDAGTLVYHLMVTGLPGRAVSPTFIRTEVIARGWWCTV